MKIFHTIKTNIMKPLLILLLLITGIGFGQPIINNPSPLVQCDGNFNFIASFDLTTQNNLILGGLSLTTHTISYHLTLTDANININQLVNPQAYTSNSQNKDIYIRVTEIATSLFSITTLKLIINPKPTNNATDYILNDSGVFNGFEIFDLNSKIPSILNGQLGCTVTFHTNLNDAESNVSQLLNNYTNISNPQTIFSRVTNNITGCYYIKNIKLLVNNPLNVYIPDTNFKAKLIALGVDSSGDGEIQYSEALTITNLNVNSLNIADLTGIEAFTNLIELDCSNNQISTINLIPLIYLESFAGLFNLLSSLTFNNVNTVKYVQCQNNLLTNVNVSNLTNLLSINLDNNVISSIDFSGLINNFQIRINNNPIVYLDFSNCTGLTELICNNNPNLTFINLKNGVQNNPQAYNILINNPNLKFICADENELSLINNILITSNITNIQLNTYCSFNPGGSFYNTLTGAVKFDNDYNGCDNLDPIVKNLKVNINDGTNSGNTFTNNLGTYNYYVQQPNLTIAPILENPSYFNVTPVSSIVNFPSNNNSVEVRDFCITANGFNPDAEVVLVALDQPIPGFNCRYQIILKNKGNTAFFQDAKFNFDPTKMTYVSSSEPYFAQTVGQVTFYNAVAQEPFEVRMYECVMRINAPTEASPVNSGDIISTSASSLVPGDNTPNDNLSTLSQVAVNSFDPNDKTCLEGNFVNPTKIGQYLHYNINFENTGTADAVNIVVKDVIDATKFDVNSLQVIYASDEVRTDVKGNVAEFIFQNINLARANGGPGGHGNVLFKIKTLPTLPINTEVKNKANIYFDYNFPIITNEAKTTFAILSNSGFTLDNSISIYPNPTSSKININCKNAIKSIEVYDVQGRILETIIDSKNVIDISNKSIGIYFLKINTDKGSKVEKIVKE